MSDLLVPGIPDNVRVPAHLRGVKLVESDVFDIANRIKAIDPNLYIVLHEKHEHPFVVMENTADGTQHMVSRYDRLDASILEDLRRMLATPFTERFAKLTAQIDKENEDQENAWMESEKHEEFIFNMKKALRDSNIADVSPGPVYFGRK